MLSDVKTAFRCTPALSFATKLLLSAFGNYSRILRLEEAIKNNFKTYNCKLATEAEIHPLATAADNHKFRRKTNQA